MHDFVEGDRVRYVGPPQPGSGEPTQGIPDLMRGEEGWVVDVHEPAGVCVVSWTGTALSIWEAPRIWSGSGATRLMP